MPGFAPDIAAAGVNPMVKRTRPPERVLLVDDDPLPRALLAAAVRHCGVRLVAEADSGPEALARLAAGQQFDLIISDLKMGGMNGLEFLSAIGAASQPALALTSALDPALLDAASAAARAQALPLLGWLEKPIVLARVRELLGRVGQPRQVPSTAPPLRAWTRAELAEALDRCQFVPFFQPKFDLAGRQPVGLEILARWRHPRFGLLSPAQFIDALEEHELLGAATLSLFGQALAGAQERAAWPGGYDLALNLSVRLLDDQMLPAKLLQLATAWNVDPHRITLELTETAVARFPDRVQSAATHLRLQGFRMAIDDFGTGYASLSQLCALPFTELKIDRSFVASLATERKARPVLEAILALGNKLDLHMVAEGIETEDECRLLRALGCRTGQGYLYARPMDATALARWQRTLA